MIFLFHFVNDLTKLVNKLHQKRIFAPEERGGMQQQWRCTGQRGLFSFPKENSPLYIPQEKGSHWQLEA